MARPGLLRRSPLGRLHARMPGWLRVVLACASIVVGVVTVIRPTTALDVLAILLGGGMVLIGILELTGRGDDDAQPRGRWAAVLGAGWIIAGTFVLLWPGLTVRAVGVVVGLLLLGNGAVGVVSALRRGRGWDARIADAAFGATGIIFGVLALAWPDITLLVVAVVFGATLIIRGVADIWRAVRRRRERARVPRAARRWGRTALAIASVAVAVVAVVATSPLREGSTVVDEFYAAPRDMPDEPGRLIRSETFSRGIPDGAIAWRILYTTTGVDGEIRAASALVVVPEGGEPGTRWPVVDWNHGTTGEAQHCAPSLQPLPFWSGAMYFLSRVVAEGWAVVATDYIGLGTEGPHPYLMGEPSAHASLDAVQAAWEMQDVSFSRSTVVWGHSQGGGAALWTGMEAGAYAPRVWVRGVAALAPAAEPAILVDHVTDIAGGSIFASFAFSSFSDVYPDITYRDYIRPGAQEILRSMAERCLTDPGTVVSVLASLGMSRDPELFSKDPTTGELGERLRENTATSWIAAPLFIGQGGADSVVPPDTQRAFVDRLCAAGKPVDYRVYAGYEHAQLMEGYSPLVDDLIIWTRARFDGVPSAKECVRQEK